MIYRHFRSLILAIAGTAVMTAAAPVIAQDTVMFNYQGRVKVHGHGFDGNGQFKFAILSPDKKSTLWSSDSTSIDGSEPTTAVTLSVTDGVFNVLMGANGVMEPINSTVFHNRRPLKLRTWFSDGVNGFQALHPDHNLINVNLITSETGGEAFTIYVNGDNGDDSNSGLEPEQAKKTIQAAVDIVPGRVMADVTIDIADGTYPEEVLLFAINAKPGKSLTLLGDEIWTPTAGGVPSVIVTGADEATTGVRDTALSAVQCTGIELVGLCFEAAGKSGVKLENGKYGVSNCIMRDNGYIGLWLSTQATGQVDNCISTNNKEHGFAITSQSRAFMTSPTGTHNSRIGIFLVDSSTVNISNTFNFSYNGGTGIHVIGCSQLGVANDIHDAVVRDNKLYGLSAGWYSYMSNMENNVILTGNLSGPTIEFNGGQVDW